MTDTSDPSESLSQDPGESNMSNHSTKPDEPTTSDMEGLQSNNSVHKDTDIFTDHGQLPLPQDSQGTPDTYSQSLATMDLESSSPNNSKDAHNCQNESHLPKPCSDSMVHEKQDDSGIVVESSPLSSAQAASSEPDFDITEETVGGINSLLSIKDDSEATGQGEERGRDNTPTDRQMLGVVEEETCEVKMRPFRRCIRKHIRPRISESDDSDEDVETSGSAAKKSVVDYSSSSEDTDEAEEDAEINEGRESGNSSSSSESMDHDKTSDIDDDEEEDDDDMDIDLVPPKDTWHPLQEVVHREYGYSSHVPSASVFRNKCGASINLVQRLNLYTKLEYHEGCVNSLHYNQQGTLLASGSDDLNIVVWNWLEKRKYFHFDSGHRSNVFQSKFLPYTCDTHIVSCARDGQLRLAELSSTGTCKTTRRLAQHRGPAHKLALLQDSSHVFYSCGEDAVTMEVDLREDKPHKMGTTKENGRKIALYSIHSNPFKSYEYCVSGRDPYIRIFDKRMTNQEENSGLVKKLCPHSIKNSESGNSTNVTCSVYSHNGQEIIGSYNDEDIYLFDTTHSDGSDALHKYQGHRNNATVKGVNFYGPKSEFVVSGSDCGNVFLWEKESEKVVQYFSGDEGGVVNVLEPHPHLPILATSGLDHDVKVWLPEARDVTKLEGLKKTIRTNKKERDEERPDPSEAIDSSVFWRLMQHFRRAARQRARQDGEDVSTDTDNSSAQDSDDNTDDSDDDNPAEPMQCVPS